MPTTLLLAPLKIQRHFCSSALYYSASIHIGDKKHHKYINCYITHVIFGDTNKDTIDADEKD